MGEAAHATSRCAGTIPYSQNRVPWASVLACPWNGARCRKARASEYACPWHPTGAIRSCSYTPSRMDAGCSWNLTEVAVIGGRVFFQFTESGFELKQVRLG